MYTAAVCSLTELERSSLLSSAKSVLGFRPTLSTYSGFCFVFFLPPEDKRVLRQPHFEGQTGSEQTQISSGYQFG